MLLSMDCDNICTLCSQWYTIRTQWRCDAVITSCVRYQWRKFLLICCVICQSTYSHSRVLVTSLIAETHYTYLQLNGGKFYFASPFQTLSVCLVGPFQGENGMVERPAMAESHSHHGSQEAKSKLFQITLSGTHLFWTGPMSPKHIYL